MNREPVYTGEYAERGEYHRNPDPGWAYYPVYIRKLAFIDEYIKKVPPEAKMLDAGCGEGVLVEKYRSQGRDISGIDLNVSNRYVLKGDILNMPFDDESFDIVLSLDVIEHLNITDQPLSLREMKRVMKKEGRIIISVPNLAHRESRRQFYKTGELIRTADINKHPGDRPVKEYLMMFADLGLSIEKRFPVKLTLSPLSEKLLRICMGKKWFEKFIYSPHRNPDDCFLNIFVLRR